MKTLFRSLAVLALTLLVAMPLVARDGKEKKKGKGGAPTPPAITAVQKQLEGLDLNDEQEGKIKDLVSQFSGKLTDAQKKAAAVLTPEMRKARKEAAEKAKADGKKGKEARAAAEAAMNLSADDKAKLEAAEKELTSVAGEFRKAVAEVLTDEQKAKAGLNAPAGKGKGKGKKKQ